ncbi:MAG: SPFH domain-containing protein [Chloroflexota bacterium]
MLPWLITWSIILMSAFGITLFVFGVVNIKANQVGIVVKRFGKPLQTGRLVALEGEAGIQADTLPPGWHFGFFPWMYRLQKVSVTVIPAGEIALIVAADGATKPPGRILGKVVPSNDFQDGRAFLKNGGERGQQLGILTPGTYRINTALFSVITARQAEIYELSPSLLMVYEVKPDKVGIVTTLDGNPIEEGEIAGPIIHDHDNFQNPQIFLDKGGRRGLQEQVLLSGTWNLNPWFVRVDQVAMTEIPIGHVGIVISFVGKEHLDVSGNSFKHGNLVDPGHKGVWVTPLYPGKHPINPRIMKVELVPTTNIVLNWATRTESHSYDTHLSPITVRSSDGFAFNLDVSQIIHIGAPEAPKVISRVGSVQNLVDHVLQPIVGNYFRNSAQAYTALDFLNARSERQREAAEHINRAVNLYDVQAIDTLIGDITPPDELMKTQTDRKIAEEERQTYEVQREAQEQRQLLVRETALAEIQEDLVKSEQGVVIAELRSNAEIENAKGTAATIRATGEAQAEAYAAGVKALGGREYVALQMMQIVGERQVRIVPDVSVHGNGDSPNGLLDGLLAVSLKSEHKNGSQ